MPETTDRPSSERGPKHPHSKVSTITRRVAAAHHSRQPLSRRTSARLGKPIKAWRAAKQSRSAREEGQTSQGAAPAPGPHSLRPRLPWAVRPRDAGPTRRRYVRCHPTARPPHGVRTSRHRRHPLSFSPSARQPRIRPPHRTHGRGPSPPDDRGHGAITHEGVACPAEAFTGPSSGEAPHFVDDGSCSPSPSGQATTCRLELGHWEHLGR